MNIVAVEVEAATATADAGAGDAWPGLSLQAGYARLPEKFFARLAPTPVASPTLIKFNEALAAELGFDLTGTPAATLAELFSGNRLPRGAAPVATAYAGHQFGGFVPQLGDGRAILLGEVTGRDGVAREIQLKGSGRTPFSRGGDGRAALGPVLREYLVSEAMNSLGVPTTRSLAAVRTGETVYRERALPGAIVTRVARSHVRVGTFQFFAARGDVEGTRCLADHVLERLYPEARGLPHPYLELLRAVLERQAALVAAWMNVGFIHGVMNTDNMAVSGETIDFGPCAFMDAYDPAAVFSSIDGRGRYAFANQPNAAVWNLARFAETLLPLIDAETSRAAELATEVIASFPARFEHHWLEGMRRKLGLATAEAADLELARGFLEVLQRNEADFSVSFRRLAACASHPDQDAVLTEGFAAAPLFQAWAATWRARLLRDRQGAETRDRLMRGANPAVIPRNHRIEEVIRAAVEAEDFAPFERLSAALSSPFADDPDSAAYRQPPRAEERVLQTFCGT
jgi:uncharacterized protein YdiU (UPF0061 family)